MSKVSQIYGIASRWYDNTLGMRRGGVGMVPDVLLEYERLIVYDQLSDKTFSLVWDTLIKADYLMEKSYQDKFGDEFWLFRKDCSQTLIRKSGSLNALFIYMDKPSDTEQFSRLTEQCPWCASRQIGAWVPVAYDRGGLPAPDRHCGVCKMRWHDSKTFKIFWKNVFGSSSK